MDDDVLLCKLETLRRCLERVESKLPVSLDILLRDYDLQDIVSVNLERAVQTCTDIALHILSNRRMVIPDTMGETFLSLARMGVLDDETALRMFKAVGFRNVAVHAYQAIDWTIVYRIITEHLDDFRVFSRQIVAFSGFSPDGRRP